MARSGKVLVGPGRPYDLILVCIVVAIAAVLPVYYPSSPPAWVLGFAAVFFCPGYAMVAALLPGQFEIIPRTFMPHGERTFTITMLERSALAVGLSATAVSLSTTVMTRGLLDLTALSVGVLLIALTFIASAVAVRRRSRLMPGDQFAIVLPATERRPFNRAEAVVVVVIIATVMMLGVVGSNALQADTRGLPYTEFSVAGADGQLDHLPSVLGVGQQAQIEVSAVNHLGRSADYTLIISLSDSMQASPFDLSQPVQLLPGAGRSMTFTLDDEGRFQDIITFSIGASGQWTVFLQLVDAGGSEVRTLWLPVTVR